MSGRPDPHHVVFHRPGPAWRQGVPLFEQDGVRLHAAHYRPWLDGGQLVLGGPFLDDGGGGMMVAAPQVPRDEVLRFALADPTVASGLLTVEVRPWYVAMNAFAPPAAA
jgi:uncharacterized protein YciI